jgi:hypothetical protein
MTASGTPGRPYSAPDQLGGNAPRSAEFTTGITGDPGNTASVSSLNQDADRFNALVPRQFAQHSVLQTAMPSANGMSATDYQRVLPGLSRPIPSPNGSSQDSYNRSLVMRLSGLHAE